MRSKYTLIAPVMLKNDKVYKSKFFWTLKALITTAADDKFCDIFPNFRKKIRYDISWELSASRHFSWNIMPYLLFLKKQNIWNCCLLQNVGVTLWVKKWMQQCPDHMHIFRLWKNTCISSDMNKTSLIFKKIKKTVRKVEFTFFLSIHSLQRKRWTEKQTNCPLGNF